MERADAQRLALIEIQERAGVFGRTVDVHRWPLTLGRAMDNDVVIDDPHLAPNHARLDVDEDGCVKLTPLPSLSGVRVDGSAVSGELRLPAGGASLQMGATRLRLRLPGEVLAPELPMPAALGGLARPLLMGLAMWLLLMIGHWISIDPGSDFNTWLPLLAAFPAVLAGWCGLWALMSKLFQHRFDFLGHLRLVLPWLLAMTVAGYALPQLAASLALPALWMLDGPVQALLAALLLRAHVAHVLQQHRRAVDITLGALVLAAGGLSLAGTWRATRSLSPALYMSTLPMPALRLAGTVPSAELVQQLGPLAQKLAERAKKSRKEDDGDEAEGDD